MHQLSRKWPRTVLVGLLAMAATAALPAVAAARPGRAGYVYVNDNTAGTNTVAAFVRHPDGDLTPVPGSPFSAGGAGLGTGLASQGSIQVSGDGRYVLAVDAGSDQISVLRIGYGGALQLVPGGVVSSGGAQPVSVAEHHGLVYVANAGASDSNYTGFTLTGGGQLRPLYGSTVPLPSTAQPGDVLFNATGRSLIGTRVGTSQIDSFRVGFDGRLTAAPGSPFPAQGVGPFGSEFRPTDPDQLFVSNAHNAAGDGTVSAFRVGSDGTLASIGGSPFADDQTAPCWVEISHDGEFLFTVNTGSGSISRYSIAADGALTLLGTTPVSAQAGVGAVDARLSTDGRTLYVDESRVDALGVFAVDGGQLTEQGSVALPAGATPAGVAVR
ncbi:MAG TPA: beta-propeller fold lactonase family protein [Solirubrobacteraceae bacterium]|nr:beta-propeller fold lactonase family protein [Solirubrobacteraceae bacterium]